MATNTRTTPSASDPIIQINLDHPVAVAVPASGQRSVTYTSTVTMVNTSKLPLSNANIELTMRDRIMGYDASLLDGSSKTALLSLDLGTIPVGGSASKQFKFSVEQIVDSPPPVTADARVQVNILPAYEIKYSKTDGYQSDASSSTSAQQSPPGVCSGWTTQPFESDPVIKVNHSFWKNTTLPLQSIGYMRGEITIENKAKLPLNSLILQFEVDDDGARYTAAVVDSSDVPVNQTNFDLGSLAPGAAPADHKYWWTLEHIGGTSVQPEKLDVTFNIMPWYQVQYQRGDDTFKVIIPATQG